MDVDTREFRRTMGLFATGVTVITARTGSIVHGMTANAVTSVSLDPLLVLFCVDNQARMTQIITESRRFAINILSQQQEALSRQFGGRPVADLKIDFVERDGVPALHDNLATLICTVDRIFDGGDHRLILGRVDAFSRAEHDTPPLLFYAGGYRQLAPQPSELLDELDSTDHVYYEWPYLLVP
jgi:flavin reductase (DIM6/NTAB) family NADH-FMN oxidoreductase RutF